MKKWLRKHNKKLQVIALLLVPPVSFYMLEAYSHNPFEMSGILQLFNILFFYAFMGLILFITGSARAAAMTTLLVPMIIGMANFYTVRFRGSPILPWDLLSLKTAMSVTNNYKFAIESRMLITALGFLALTVLASFIRIRLPKFSKKSAIVRGCGTLLSVLLFFALFSGLQNTGVKKFLALDETLFTPNNLYKKNGFTVSFVYNLQYIEIDKPEDYSLELVKDIMEPYMDEVQNNHRTQIEDNKRKPLGAAAVNEESAETTNENDMDNEAEMVNSDDVSDETVESDATEQAGSEGYPNIIVIMNEAFSDLSVLGDFETNEDYMPFFRSLTENTVRGDLFVSVKGGNTANTEFEFLTGDSMAFLPQGSVAYQQYINQSTPSLASWLGGLGYATAGLHPYNASGWDRDEVYPYFGFDESLFLPQFTHRHKIRKYVSDESAFEQIKDLYESKEEGKPLFAFEVTMQNHGGYYQDYEDFIPEISLEITEGTDKNRHYTEQYLSLLKKTDEAFEELIEYFAAQPEKTIVVMFGDHQPADLIAKPILLHNDKLEDTSLENEQNRYIVPFVIWANYDIEEREIERLSVNYLSTLVLDTAGVPKTGYQEFLSDLSEVLPVITANVYIDAEGNYYNSSDNPYSEKISQYEVLQYYHLFDDDQTMKEFYGITE